MAQFLDIFAFVSVLLRGMTLAFEALTVGGVIFVLAIARKTSSSGLTRFLILFSTCWRSPKYYSWGLIQPS